MKKLLTFSIVFTLIIAIMQVNAQQRVAILNESLLSQESFNKFTAISVTGDQTWRVDTRYGAVMNGNYNDQNYSNEDWLISPEINLLDKEDVKFFFQHTRGNAGVMNVGVNEGWYKVFATDSFTGEISTTTWVEIENIIHATEVWDFVPSGELEFPESTISAHTRFAFRYISSNTQSATWEIKNTQVTYYDSSATIEPPIPNHDSILKVTTWNTEWLGCPDNKPYDIWLQLNNVARAIQLMNCDIIALQEVTQSSRLPSIDTLVALLGDEYEGNIVTWNTGSCKQNQGIIYKKSKIQIVNSSLISNGDVAQGNSYYYNWSSGRYPVLYNVNVIVGEELIPLSIINIHSKAMGDEESYTRRKGGSEGLKAILDRQAYNTKRLIVIGDFNDYFVGTQCSDCGPGTESPYKNFISDSLNYRGITTNLRSGSRPLIDNILISLLHSIFNGYILLMGPQ